MNFKLVKYLILAVVIFTIFHIPQIQGQEEDDDELEAYEEEPVDQEESPTTRRYRPSTAKSSDRSRNDTQSTSGVTSAPVAQASATVTVAAALAPTPQRTSPPMPPPAPTRAAIRATTLSESQEEDVTEMEDSGYGYIFSPLNNLIDNVVAGNITGIVDNALSIRTPPEIRRFVNNVMSNVFGAGVGSALRQFAPNFFSSTRPPPPAGIEPIPVQTVQLKAPVEKAPPVQVIRIVQPLPPPPPQSPPTSELKPEKNKTPVPIVASGVVARTNGTEGNNKPNKTTNSFKKQQVPIQLKFKHPGAPASRLRCEVIME